MKKTAVVILNWNGRKLLEQFLPSVVQHTIDNNTSVVVADNGSTDDSRAFTQSHYPMVEWLQLPQNYGFAGGYNKALAQIDAEYYVLLNSDVEVEAGWLEPMVEYMDLHSDVAACGPKIIDYKDKELFEYAGGAGGYIDRYGFPFCRGRVFTTIEKDLGQFDTMAQCIWVSGCCLLVRASAYSEASGLDERFFAHMEEVDLCWRMHNRGLKIVNLPTTRIFHVGGASLANEHPEKTFLNFRNSLLCVYKNTGNACWATTYIVRILLDTVAAAKFALTDGLPHSWAVFRAHREFNKLKKQYKEFRKSNASESFAPGVFRHSLVVAYYLKGKKYYRSLVE
jgi:GT2 family glycosyltransferase